MNAASSLSGIFGRSHSGSVDSAEYHDEDDARAFDRRPATQPRGAVNRLGVWNLHVVARPVEPPAVERAGRRNLHDGAADGDVGTEVRAVGVEHIRRRRSRRGSRSAACRSSADR